MTLNSCLFLGSTSQMKTSQVCATTPALHKQIS